MSIIIICVVVIALTFEFINGFHDTANAVATTVYTKALTLRHAIMLAAAMNFLGALVSENVAKTITSGLVSVDVEEYVVLAALLGAITWNLFTWWRGIPSSSSHALIGSLIGAVIVYTATLEDIQWSGVLSKVVIPLFTSPLVGFFVAFMIMKLIFKVFANRPRKRVNGVFHRLQVLSAAFFAFSHGTNDAQKTMGIITLALIAGGITGADDGVPLPVKILCATAMACGTAAGGKRIMKTMGHGVTKLEPSSGFAAEVSSALIIEAMSFLGSPISTTHVISSAVMGVGSAKRLSAVKWRTARNLVMTWIITLPVAIAMGGVSLLIVRFIYNLAA
jgi:PiT family inorganic phosphate transporter